MKVKPQPDLLSAVGSPNRVPRRRGVTHVLGRGGRQLPEGEWSWVTPYIWLAEIRWNSHLPVPPSAFLLYCSHTVSTQGGVNNTQGGRQLPEREWSWVTPCFWHAEIRWNSHVSPLIYIVATLCLPRAEFRLLPMPVGEECRPRIAKRLHQRREPQRWPESSVPELSPQALSPADRDLLPQGVQGSVSAFGRRWTPQGPGIERWAQGGQVLGFEVGPGLQFCPHSREQASYLYICFSSSAE